MIYNPCLTQKNTGTVTVTSKNFDGSIINTTKVTSGDTPTHADPQYDIPFTGWSPAPAPVSEDTTYVAQYSLPTGMSQTISQSWAEIIADAESGQIGKYKELDTKMMFTEDGHALCLELAGKLKDTVEGGEKNAAMTWVSRTVYGTCQWNLTDDNTGGYPASNYKKYLEETCFPNLPDEIQKAAQSVVKYCHSYSPDTNNMSYTAKVWPPSVHELNYVDDGSYESTGVEYSAYSSHAQRKRYDSSGTAVRTWLSSANYSGTSIACNIGTSGDWGSSYNCSNSYGALLCFCLGTHSKDATLDADGNVVNVDENRQ